MANHESPSPPPNPAPCTCGQELSPPAAAIDTAEPFQQWAARSIAELQAHDAKVGSWMIQSWEAHTFSIQQHQKHVRRWRDLWVVLMFQWLMLIAIAAALFARAT